MTSKACARLGLTFTAALAAMMVALMLAGCGRIGALDLPPGVTSDLAPNPSKPTHPPPGANVIGTTQTPLLGSTPTSTAPTAAPGEKRPLPIDWLLN